MEVRDYCFYPILFETLDYLLYLKDGQAILQNNVLFYKNNHIIKSLVIHISLSTDTTKGNEEYYNIEP